MSDPVFDGLRRFVDDCEALGMTGEEFVAEFWRQVCAPRR